MICKQCHHEMGPEELKCPNCGADNPFAVQHEKNIKGFQKEYEETEKEVFSFAGKVKKLGKKAAILTLLLAGIILMSIVASFNYEDPDPDRSARKDAVKNAASYSGQIDTYLKNGEYMECVSFLYAHEITRCGSDAYQKYRCISYVAMDYYECMKYIEQMVLRSTDEDYYDSLDTTISNFCMYLERFYETLENMKTQEKEEEYLVYMEDMDEELKTAMRIYFKMDEKELDRFLDLSQAKKAVKISEVFRNEK